MQENTTIKIIKIILFSILSLPFYYKKRIVLAVFLIAATSFFNILTPIFFKEIVDKLQVNEPIYLINITLLTYALIWVAAQIITQLREIISYRFMEKATNNLCIRIFNHLHNLSHKYHLVRHTGSVINSLERAQGAVPKVFWGVFFYVVPTTAEVLIASSIIMNLYGPSISFVLIGTICAYVLFTLKFSSIAVSYMRKAYLSHTKAVAWAVDSLLNFETVKFFNNEGLEVEKYQKVLDEREIKTAKSRAFLEAIHLGQGVIIGIGLGVVTWVVGQKVISGQLELSDFILINGYFIQFAAPLSHLGSIFRNIREGFSNLESVIEILEAREFIPESKSATNINYRTGDIKFHKITFGYDSEREILEDFNLEIKGGSSLGIVGMTGSGKSSILRLLMRFYDPDRGSIFIDNQNIKDLHLNSLRKIFGIVPQDTVLFNTSIRENILYGNQHASSEDLEEAVIAAGLKAFIDSLPDSYETLVGERGLKLSGGEKQRIAIARVILKKPKIFLFDEATSALDTKTEREIQKNLLEIARGHTTIIIAHRLSTLQNANRIVVMEGGKIIEDGSHSQLLMKKGKYYELWNKQHKKSHHE